jgi:Small-conductance mechanosensitive channel
MPDQIAYLNTLSEQYPTLHILLAVLLLAFLSWFANWVTKTILLRAIRQWFFSATLEKGIADSLMRFIRRLSNVIPALVISIGVKVIPDLPETLITITENVCSAFIVLTLALALAHLLDWVNMVYQQRPEAARKPIKGYVQVIKIVIYAVAAILIIATLIDRSPLILLSGLGAMAAVLMLIFQDTLLSLVASVQLNSNDMVRVGDWIEMPQLNADGDVVDIALHTVKVQNWDKTITMIPTKRMISDSFKNWRGMSESGGRRIKRSLYIDQQSVRFLTDDECKNLERFVLIDDYLRDKEEELQTWNEKISGEDQVNYRRLTNIGTFRAYILQYLTHHPGIHQAMTKMVRQLSPTSDGLPLEIYCFTSTTAWVAYEGIQSDIFDHLLAIIPEFGLRVFQHPSGVDMRRLREGLSFADEKAR